MERSGKLIKKIEPRYFGTLHSHLCQSGPFTSGKNVNSERFSLSLSLMNTSPEGCPTLVINWMLRIYPLKYEVRVRYTLYDCIYVASRVEGVKCFLSLSLSLSLSLAEERARVKTRLNCA